MLGAGEGRLKQHKLLLLLLLLLGARPCRRVDAMVTAFGAHAARAHDAMKLQLGLPGGRRAFSGLPAGNLPAF